MPFQDQLAGLAGAALGYIHGNTRGAIKGYYAGTKLSQYSKTRMAPITPRRTPKKRKLSLSRRVSVSTNASSRRRSSVSSKGSGKSQSSYGDGPSMSRHYGDYRSISSNASAIRVRHKKGITKKKAKSVVVTKKFKQRVHKALDEEIKGKYLKVTYFRIPPVSAADQQTLYDDTQSFMPLHFADAADILFNRAAAIEIPTVATLDWNNIAIRKDRILDSWVSYEVKNMSQRTYTLKMYTCKPRVKSSTNSAPNDAAADWTVGLQTAIGAGTNPAGNTPNTLYSVPFDSPQFNQLWKAEVSTVVLAPGQCHTFRVQGPSEYTLDYMKYWNKSIVSGPDYLSPWGSFTRNVFFVAHADLVTSTMAGAGRFVSAGAGIGGMVVEKKHFFSLACPASAGFQYPGAFAAGTSQQLTNKLPCKVIKIFGSGTVGAVQDILEENPLAVVDPVD